MRNAVIQIDQVPIDIAPGPQPVPAAAVPAL